MFVSKKHLHLKTLSKSVTVLVTLFGELTYFRANNRGRKAADILKKSFETYEHYNIK